MNSKTMLAGVCAALLLAGPAAAEDKDTEALEAELKKLEEKVKQLEEGRKATDARVDVVEVRQGDAVVAGDIPGSFRVPGTELSLRVYGFAELNWIHAFKADNADVDYSTFAPYLPLEGTAGAKRRNRDYLTGRTSRLGVESGMPTRFGVLSAKIEGDFNNEPRTGGAEVYGVGRNVSTQQATNSYGFRLRHAYGQFAGLLAGQTWSTFMDVDNFPETVDYNGPIGATFIRQPQIRYAYPTLKAGTFTVALENSASYVYDRTASTMPSSASRLPDVVVRWDRSFAWGAMSVRGVTHEVRVNDSDAGVAASARGWGAGVALSCKPLGPDFLALQVTGGEGIGRYLNYIEGALYDDAAKDLLLEKAVGAVVGYQYKPADWARVNLVYGMTHTLNNAFVDLAKDPGIQKERFFGSNRWVHQAHAGPIFTPVKGVDLGVEGVWAKRVTLGGARGDDLRVNFSAKYYIN